MEIVKLPIHKHPLLSVTRFHYGMVHVQCSGCNFPGYIYGGYRCNELGCTYEVFHKVCAESLPKINHPSHPDHPLKLHLSDEESVCSRCGVSFENGYLCSICDFKLDLRCAVGQAPPLILERHNLHEHPLEIVLGTEPDGTRIYKKCKTCDCFVSKEFLCYECSQCELYFHEKCANFSPEANHISHHQHPLKLFLAYEGAPDYADKKCLLCGIEFYFHFHHCDICNFSICEVCMANPPPLVVSSLTTHEHQLYLFPRRIDFTCNACGTLGDRSPYFCLQCNFMIHSACIDLPRVIHINRHDHRVSYTRRLGHGNWKCGVCRKIVDGFYGAYSCSKCSHYVVHSRCATRFDVWDALELEGTPEEEEIPPFEVIDANTIKHFSHDHNLRINKDGQTLLESTPCQACIFQICSEAFYGCEQCDFVLHQKCANLPRKKRHVSCNQCLTLHTDPPTESKPCRLCDKHFSGFRYEPSYLPLDVRCGSITEPFKHESHPHPLFYTSNYLASCTTCGESNRGFICDECVGFKLCFACGMLPQKVTRHRYDDHPLFLFYGESNVEGDYWCEACETKVNPKKWFYTCNDCGVVLHISCVVGDFSYLMPSSRLELLLRKRKKERRVEGRVEHNTSVCRLVCTACNYRCKLPSVLKVSNTDIDVYCCSLKCLKDFYLPPLLQW